MFIAIGGGVSSGASIPALTISATACLLLLKGWHCRFSASINWRLQITDAVSFNTLLSSRKVTLP